MPAGIDDSRIYLGARSGGSVAAPGTPGPGGLPLVASGKVRDLYALDPEHILFVTTDRLSAFDVVMAEGVPGKGRTLTAIAVWWFERTRDVIENHLVSASVDDVPGLADAEREALEGRVMIVRRTEPTTVEWVVRAYLAGSGWKEYQSSGGLWGHSLPAGIQHAGRLPEALLTPTTKDEDHDRPIDLDEARRRVGDALFEQAHAASLALFARGTETLAGHGLLLADTKFEFGTLDGKLLLIDEALTPDSSRMWPADQWAPGTNPPAYDKQPLRDWLETQPWDKNPPAPPLDPDVVARLSARYAELRQRLTGA